jgi:hypothetical protein
MADEDDKRYFVDVGGDVRSVSGAERIRSVIGSGRQLVSPEAARQSWQDEKDKAYVDERYGAVGKGVMGGLQGLSMGLGPAAGAALAGMVDPEAGEYAKRDLRAMSDDTGFMVGDVAGMVLPTLLSGGGALEARGLMRGALAATPAGLVGQAGSLAERLVMRSLPATSGLGRMGQTVAKLAAQGATEAALMNLGHEIGQNIIHDHEITASGLAAAGLEGALFGGLVGAGIGGIGAGVGRLGEVLGGAASKAAAKRLGGELAEAGGISRHEAVAARQMGATADDITKMASEGNFREALTARHKIIESGGADLSASTSQVNRISKQAKGDFVRVQENILKDLDRGAPMSAPRHTRVFGEPINQNGNFVGFGSSRVESEIIAKYRGTMAEGAAQSEVLRLYDDFRQTNRSWTNYSKSVRHLDEQIALMPEGFRKTIYSDVRSILDDEFMRHMQAASEVIGKKGLSEQYAAAIAGERTAGHLAEMTEKKLAKDAAAAEPGLTPRDVGTMAGIAITGHPIAAGGYGLARMLGKTMEQKVAPKIAEMAYQMATGASAAAAPVRVGDKVRGAVKKFFKAGNKTASAVNASMVTSRKDFERRLERTTELVSPQHAARVQAHADEVSRAGHPDLARAITDLYARASGYLAHNLPMGTMAQKLSSLGPVPEVHGLSSREYQFAILDNAIKDPLSIIGRIEFGDISRDEVLAIKSVYPELHAQVVDATQQEILAMKQAGDYLAADKIVSLGVVLDAPVDSMLEKEFIDHVQMSLHTPPQEPQGGGPPPQSHFSNSDLQTPLEKALS